MLGDWNETRHDGCVINVTEPQVWVLIGVFATVMFALLRFVTQSTTKILRTEFGRMGDRFEEVHRRFDEVLRRFADMDRRFDGLEARIGAVEGQLAHVVRRVDGLDRDVHAISAHIFPSTGDPRVD